MGIVSVGNIKQINFRPVPQGGGRFTDPERSVRRLLSSTSNIGQEAQGCAGGAGPGTPEGGQAGAPAPGSSPRGLHGQGPPEAQSHLYIYKS